MYVHLIVQGANGMETTRKKHSEIKEQQCLEEKNLLSFYNSLDIPEVPLPSEQKITEIIEYLNNEDSTSDD